MMHYFGSLTAEITQREKDNSALAREAARGGFVLLKNDGALPLKSREVALYGMGARRTITGGTGSGDMNERYSVSIEEGLENAGYTITTKQYLDDYDREHDTAHASWRESVEEMIAPLPPMEGLMKALEVTFQIPEGRKVTMEDIEASQTDTAVYVLSRQAGEGNDRKMEAGDYQISGIEYANLTLLGQHYAHIILVINIGGMMDLTFLNNIKGIDALVYYVQGGMEGGNALADVLSGRYSFSGKLTDTWAIQYADYPSSSDFSYLNGNLEDEDYNEGIYIGYRYFDSFGVKPLFPFGYGLSYADFVWKVKSVVLNGTVVRAKVEVTNTSDTYTGRETVQAYISCPDGKLRKEYQRLVGFVKTGEIKSGETQTVEICFDLTVAASYDEEIAAYILEVGDYLLRIGNSSHDTVTAAVLSMPETMITEQCRNCCRPLMRLSEIEAPANGKGKIPTDAVRIMVCSDAIVAKMNDYTEPSVKETEQEKILLDSLTIPEMAELLIGGDLHGNGAHQISGAAGKTAITLNEKKISNIVLSDGPAGLNIVNHVAFTKEGVQKSVSVPERYSFGAFAKVMQQRLGSPEDTQVYRYATAWPVGTLLAQTWDLALIEKVGAAVGTEMEEFGITLWLAPGMNIHRNPLCGRAFEYYSEDPLLSGMMASAMTKGVQSHVGIGTTVKHFCCNNQEDNRAGVSSNINERALREIYLKGFEIAVKRSQPLAVMSSYNRLNKIYTANNHDLLTAILRCEWGFSGVVMTDWNGQSKPERCAPAGNDLVMAGSEADKQAILNSMEDGSLTPEVVRTSASRVLRIVMQGITG